MKRTFFFAVAFFSLFAGSLAFAQHPVKPKVSEQSWRVLDKAEDAFERGDYGEAVSLCEAAKESRAKELEWNRYVMEAALRSPEIKRKGPFISDLIPVLKDREDFEALEIVNAWLDKKGADFFGNSLPNLYEWLKRLSEYPECDFLLAKIYRLEGEYGLAARFLRNAWEQSDLLDVPAQKADILYESADLAKATGDLNEFEKNLLLVAADDSLSKDEAAKRAMARSAALKRKDAVDYFFKLNRHSSPGTIRAYFALGELYEEQKRPRDAWNMASSGAVCAFTWTLEILRDRSPEYSFDTLEGFFAECGRYEDVMAWAGRNGVWKGFFDMAGLAVQNGWERFGTSLWSILASSCPDAYWAAAAKNALGE